MSELTFYFPAPILMQYTDVTSTKELRNFAEENPTRLYLDFVHNTENDVHTTILIPPNLRARFLEYRNALYGLILGKDLKLYFSKEAPEIPEWDPSELSYYLKDIDPKDIGKLKLRKYKVIERIIITDLVFRLYYDVYPKIKDVLKEFREVEKLVKNFTIKKSSRYAVIEREFVPFDRHRGSNVFNIHYPEQLRGFKAVCFPLMSWSGIVQLGMLHFFVSGRWMEVDQVVGEIKQYEINGRIIQPKVIMEPTDEFLSDCKTHYYDNIDKYIKLIRRFVEEVRAIADEKDPLEELILTSLPATFFELYDRVRTVGYDPDEFMFKLRDLIRRGKVKVEGERLLPRGGSHE